MKIFKLIKLVVVAGVAAGSYSQYKQRFDPAAMTQLADAAANGSLIQGMEPSANGFVQMPPLVDLDPNTVTVFAAENCPQEDARRADNLAEALRGSGIPVKRTHSINMTVPGGQEAMMAGVNAIMNGNLPIVFVNGRARANPNLQDVIAEFKGPNT